MTRCLAPGRRRWKRCGATRGRLRRTPGWGSSTFCSTGTGPRRRARSGRRCSSNRRTSTPRSGMRPSRPVAPARREPALDPPGRGARAALAGSAALGRAVLLLCRRYPEALDRLQGCGERSRGIGSPACGLPGRWRPPGGMLKRSRRWRRSPPPGIKLDPGWAPGAPARGRRAPGGGAYLCRAPAGARKEAALYATTYLAAPCADWVNGCGVRAARAGRAFPVGLHAVRG